MSTRMSYSSEPSEDGHMLPKTERETFTMSKKTKRGHSLSRLALVAVLSSAISVLVTLFTHQVALSQTPHKPNESLLPGLDIPQLGTFESVFKPEGIYRQPPSNRTREAWMGLFPKGKGYISTIELEKVGPIPQFIQDMPTDGSGRFCIAAFHQMHCLYLIQSEFHQALEGSISKPGPHTRHCIDYLRSSIMCAADTTLEPFTSRLQGFSGGDSVDGFDSPHKCRSYDQLYEWAERFRYNDNTDADHFNG